LCRFAVYSLVVQSCPLLPWLMLAPLLVRGASGYCYNMVTVGEEREPTPMGRALMGMGKQCPLQIGEHMSYAVVTAKDAYHIGDILDDVTLCGITGNEWSTMLDCRNRTLGGSYSLIMGRKSACKTCEKYGAKALLS